MLLLAVCTRGEKGGPRWIGQGMVVMLEVFNTAWHALAIVCLLFGQRVWTHVWDGCSAGSSATIEELERMPERRL